MVGGWDVAREARELIFNVVHQDGLPDRTGRPVCGAVSAPQVRRGGPRRNSRHSGGFCIRCLGSVLFGGVGAISVGTAGGSDGTEVASALAACSTGA